MPIEHIKVQNFKSFKYLDIELGRFTVIIGANASGKSNFTQVFKFLNDIKLHGLDNAVSQQGGMEYLLNFADQSSSLSYEITFNERVSILSFISRMMGNNVAITKVVYRFEIRQISDSNIKIIGDELNINVDVSKDKEKIPLSLIISNKNSQIKVDIDCLQKNQIKYEIEAVKKFVDLFFDTEYMPQSLLLENPLIASIILGSSGGRGSDIKIYNFDPKLAKLPVKISGSSELESDGSNLSVAMKNTMRNSNKRKTFSNLIGDVLPFVCSIDTGNLLDSSVMIVQKENYFENKPIPAILISDGTINVTALICALYFQRNSLTIIEEPERNIHPALIAKIVDMMKDASNKKQIIATTHSAEVVRHVDIANILLIKRDEVGNSQIIKPSNQEDVKEFLKNDMDIRELYVQNMLGD